MPSPMSDVTMSTPPESHPDLLDLTGRDDGEIVSSPAIPSLGKGSNSPGTDEPSLLLYNTSSDTRTPASPRYSPSPVADAKKPNYKIAEALATFHPSLAFKVLNCWQAPFFRPCRQPRLCPSCARYRQRRLALRYERCLTEMVSPFWLTVTIPCKSGLTRWHLNRFRKKLTSLRRWRRFQRSVRGGFYSIEIKLGDSGLWNIHAHIVLDLADHTLAERDMTAAWIKRTGGAMVKFGPIRAGTLGWVFSYSTKPQELPMGKTVQDAVSALVDHGAAPLDPARLREFYWATRGFRNAQTFGNFNAGRGKSPTKPWACRSGGPR